MDELLRAQELAELAERARRRGVDGLSDDDLLRLLNEQRWALRLLAHRRTGPELRVVLQRASLDIHAALRRCGGSNAGASVGQAIANVGGCLATAVVVFLAAALCSAVIVLNDPVLAIALAPRELILQIDAGAWSARSSTTADIGMTLYYWGNNLRAALLALSLGVLGGLPGLVLLAYNGVVLGAVVASAYERGAAAKLLAWVLPHGVPELSALVLSSAIGLALGLAWISGRAGARTRNLIQRGETLVPLVGVAALLVLCAAPLEGFVSPRQLPFWVDGGIALGWVMVLGIGARYALASRSTFSKARSGA